MAEQFLDVNAANHVVGVARVNREASVRPRADDFAQFAGGRSNTNRDQMHARHHHLSSREISKLEELPQDVPRFAAEQSALLAFLDDQLQLLGGVVPLFVRRCA